MTKLNRRRRWPLVTGVVFVLVFALVVAGYLSVRPLLRTATGYAAHNHCAVTNLAGRADPSTDLPPNPLVPYLVSEDSDGKTSSALFGWLARQSAWASEHGCVVAAERPELGSATPIQERALLQEGELDPALEEAISIAFGDNLEAQERESLGTRAVLVVRDGVIVAERYAAGFDAQTRQLGWSMTKSVANLYAGVLVADGVLALDEDHLVPEWSDGRAEITVEQLLRMTSGLAWDESYELGSPITRMLYDEPDMGAFVASQPLAHEPGSYLQYSSGSTTLLCSIISERVGGADDIRTRLFAPLGLTSAVLETDASGTPVCSSYLWASPRDWAKIGQFALNDGVVAGQRLLPEGWMAASSTVTQVAAADEQGYASSWWTNQALDGSLRFESLPKNMYWAQGHDGQRLFIVPDEGVVVVRLGFTPVEQELHLEQLVAAAVGDA